MARTKLSPSVNIVLIGLGLTFAIVVLVLIRNQLITRPNNETTSTNAPVTQVSTGSHTFDVKRITMVDNAGCFSLTFDKNGQVAKVTCDLSMESRAILSNQEIQSLLQKLSQAEFNELLPEYFSENLNITLIIETNYGTKEVVISDKGTVPIDGVIEEIIEDIEEIEDTLETPRPSSLPTTPPSPTPNPQVSPTPSIGPNSTPTPIPTPITGSPEPFTCADLERQGVTVSNIRCIDEGTTAY